MRFIAVVLLIACTPCLDSPLAAQAPPQGRIVVLDGGAANLMRACCPMTTFESFIRSESDSYDVLNRRAWSMRDASCLIYRSDQMSMTSRLFRDRLMAQGVHVIDLAAYAAEQSPVPRKFQVAVGPALQVSEKQSFVMSLAIEQFRKVSDGF